MPRARRLLLVALALAGEVLALAAAWGIVALRYRWEDRDPAAASAGMSAFGDSVLVLAGFGALSLPATWLLFRALRELDRFWRALSWAGVCWAALAPVAAAVRLVAAGAAATRSGPATSPLLVADALSLVRLLAISASLPGLALALWACRHPPSTRRLRLAVVLEAAGLAGFFLWLGWALLRGR